MYIDIEDLIKQDICQISNTGNRTQREKSLRKYYSNPNYCKYCGTMIFVQKDQKTSETKKKKFCNKTCAAKYNNKTRINVKSGPPSILYSYSDNDFIDAYNSCTSYRQLIAKLGYKMANAETTNKIRNRVKLLGLNDYNEVALSIESSTKGELISKSANWQSWRGKIQKHARETYQNSNKPKKCIICEYDKTYEVAHIKAVSSYSDDTLISEINNIDNLIALCPNHHWEYDNGHLNLENYLLNIETKAS